MNRPAEQAPGESGEPTVEERVRRLEAQTETLIEAVEELARGLEGGPMAGPQRHPAGQAARRTHELLLLAKSAPRPGLARVDGGEAG
jgi:hypothetical protein